MNNALIGHSGFVGTTLLRQTRFQSLFRSTNIDTIADQSFDAIICAGAPAQKWLANREPAADLVKINALIANLKKTTARNFILISTVDVFKNPIGVDESTPIDENGLQPYGRHRRLLESFVQTHFSNHLIVRLPGLVGPGLRKNIIFDGLNGNNVQSIDARGVFQFYPMVNLWYDIQIALQEKLKIVHLTAEPISVSDIFEKGFGKILQQTAEGQPAKYDFQTQHASCFGKSGRYQYTQHETILAVRAYAQSEPKVVLSKLGSHI
jgi:dTDP-4-dehydrorhamnose reductase